MPCFRGLAVSVHAANGALTEHGVQRNHRVSRISSYIQVPTGPSLNFALSITLLVPGQPVPYSAPPRTPDNPWPDSKYVSTSGLGNERGAQNGSVGPYIPLTHSENETVAAYIHFNGRAKEEVATLLRRGEETWVNSRWVSVPASEGGGLAEREFLFREVGLERWLNGLDLQGGGKEVAARIAKRKQKLEKKRVKKESNDDSSGENTTKSLLARAERRRARRENVLRYGEDKSKPIEALEDSESGSNSDSEDEIPEAAGQIKVSLFRVLASGEVKRGEYSPQFDAHDDDEMDRGEGEDGNADVDHTTTFAKPKTLDPKSISTQTVTGIDPPERPFASFTFFYRGKKQLQKMGILQNAEASATSSTQGKTKPKQFDPASLGKLKAKEGTVGFSGYRDTAKKSSKPFGEKSGKTEDSDADDEDDSPRRRADPAIKVEDDDDGEEVALSPEESKRRAELAEKVNKMQLKRQHSFDAPASSSAVGASTLANETTTPTTTDSNAMSSAAGPGHSPTSSVNGSNTATPSGLNPGTPHLQQLKDASGVSNESPFKRQRASLEDNRPSSSFAGRMGASAFSNFNAADPGSSVNNENPRASFGSTNVGSGGDGGSSAMPDHIDTAVSDEAVNQGD